MDFVFEKTLTTYAATAAKKDVEGHLALYAEDVAIFDMWEEWSLQGLPALREMITEWFHKGDLNSARIEWEDLREHAQGDLAYGSAIVKYSDVGNDGQVRRWLQNRMTLVLEKRGGAWKIVHQHTSVPVGGEDLKGRLQRQD